MLQECTLNFSSTLMFCGKWSFNPVRHTWPMSRIIGLKQLEYALLLPPNIQDIMDVVSAFFHIPATVSRQGMNVGFADTNWRKDSTPFGRHRQLRHYTSRSHMRDAWKNKFRPQECWTRHLWTCGTPPESLEGRAKVQRSRGL